MHGTMFETESLVEATLMFIRKKDVECQWVDNRCVFVFTDCTEAETAAVCDPHAKVEARAYSKALRNLKNRMYATPGSPEKSPRRRR